MPSLNYATGVTSQPQSLFNGIGWFNYVSLPASMLVTNSTPFVATISNDLKGGGSITARFTLSITGNTRTVNFTRNLPPLYPGATFGLTAYTGLTQRVCLSNSTDQAAPNFGVITVDNITILNKYGIPITNYNFYFMDSETPQGPPSNETFTTNGTPWSIFYTPPANGANTGMSGIGTTTAQNTTQGNMPVLLTRNPTSITQTVTGGGAMSFGVSLTTAEIVKVITNRLDPSDQFELSIIGPNSGTTITAGTSTGVQQQGVQVISGNSGQSVFTFNETMASGSSSPLSYYSPTVQVSNLTQGGTALPSTINLGSSLTLNLGDFALVTITNTPAPTVVTLAKTVNKSYAEINETLTYTLVCKNSSPYEINNLVITDTIPTFTTLKPNSLFVDGVQNGGTVTPPTGLALGTLTGNATTTITFDVIVQGTIPNPNRVVNNANANFTPKINIGSVNSQSVVTTINKAFITSTKSRDKAYANVGDIITYFITLSNTGNTTATNILFIDTIPNDTSLVAGSFKQDGALISGSPNPPGATLPNTLKANGVTTVTFQVKVLTIPNPNPIPNNAAVNYRYVVDPSTVANTTGIDSSNTNTVNTQVNNANLGNIIKLTDKSYADCGDTINYIIVVPNSGNTTAQNVVFKDTIPNGTSLITTSVFVNGVQQLGATPITGITVPNIAPGTISTITFSVSVQC